MSSLLIQNVRLDDRLTSIAIRGNRIDAIGDLPADQTFDQTLDGTGLLACPPFYNTHTHAAMTLLRGMADKLQLFDWLNNHIWPAEATLTPELIHWGTKLACLEMIKSGTVFLNDMYFRPVVNARACDEMGMRAAVGMQYLDINEQVKAANEQDTRDLLAARDSFSDRIQFTLAPHAVYTVSEPAFREVAERSVAEGYRIHLHLAETQQEVDDCRRLHHGLTPTQYLDSLGVLTDQTIAAHAIHLTDQDIDTLAQRGVWLSHNACSNFKLNSGSFRFRDTLAHGCRITIGTDGCASNDSLSMFDDMKTAVFNARHQANDPTAAGAADVLTCATANGAAAFGIDAGVIEPGRHADIMLNNTRTPQMLAQHDWKANLVYACDSACVHTLICDGRILMLNRHVPAEDDILDHVQVLLRNWRRP